jgi:hypothetical protein
MGQCIWDKSPTTAGVPESVLGLGGTSQSLACPSPVVPGQTQSRDDAPSAFGRDQSAGKSSVLEAVTEIPFPRNDNLCTRFATEITLRRGLSDLLIVRVIPDPARPSAEQASIKACSETMTVIGSSGNQSHGGINLIGESIL